MNRRPETIIPQHVGLGGRGRRPPGRRSWIGAVAGFLWRQLLFVTVSLLIWPLITAVAWLAAPAAVIGFAAWLSGFGGGDWLTELDRFRDQAVEGASAVIEGIGALPPALESRQQPLPSDTPSVSLVPDPSRPRSFE